MADCVADLLTKNKKGQIELVTTLQQSFKIHDIKILLTVTWNDKILDFRQKKRNVFSSP